MDYEFDFGNETDGENPVQQNPAPVEDPKTDGGNRLKKRGTGRKILYRLLALVASFALGSMACYFSFDPELRSLAKLKGTIQGKYYKEITDEEFYDVVFDAVNGKLLDRYSAYMTADEYAADLAEGTGYWSGIGIDFLIKENAGDESTRIATVSGNSPAEKAGIEGGAYLVGFGKTEESVEHNPSFTDFEEFLKGQGKGETFYVKIKDGEDIKIVSLAKKAFVENYVYYRTSETGYRFEGQKATTMVEFNGALRALDQDTAYIRLTQFNGNAAEQFKKAMDKFKADGKKHLVLDLRANGGGYMDILSEIASYFTKNTKSNAPLIAVATERSGKTEKFYAEGNYFGKYFQSDSKIRVLADNGTASASECLIGAMVDYGAVGYGDIFLSYRGETAKTYGKGIMQTTYPLSPTSGSTDAVRLTTATIRWPVSGRCIHDIGLTVADGCPTLAEDEYGDGEILAALETIKNNL